MSHAAPSEPDPIAAASRRRAERRESSGPLRVVLQTTEFSGRLDNISALGVFFYSKQRLRVQVELEQDGVQRTISGHLVRVVAMNPEESGFAIEFDQRS